MSTVGEQIGIFFRYVGMDGFIEDNSFVHPEHGTYSINVMLNSMVALGWMGYKSASDSVETITKDEYTAHPIPRVTSNTGRSFGSADVESTVRELFYIAKVTRAGHRYKDALRLLRADVPLDTALAAGAEDIDIELLLSLSH